MFDLLVIFSYLLATLWVGLRAGIGMKSIEEFAVAGRSYSSLIIFMTLSATFLGGGYTFGLAGQAFDKGLVFAFVLFGFSLQQLLVARFIAPQMDRFKDAFSVGDLMGQFYGKGAKILTGIASLLVCSGIIGAQVGAIGHVFNIFLDIPHLYGALIGCSIVIIYATFGGMRAVVATDVIQFIVLIIALPATLVFGLIAVGGWGNLEASLPAAHTEWLGELSIIAFLSLFFSLFIGETLVPPYVQRLLIAKDAKKTARGTMASALLSVPVFLLCGTLGLIAHKLDPTLESTLALPFVIKTVLPVGLKGLAIAGLIAVVMSSADSFLNAASIAFIHDIVRPLRSKSRAPKRELRLTQITTFIVGISAIFFALSIKDVLSILLYAYNFWAPIILIPLVAGVLGKTIKTKQFYITAAISASTCLLWSIFAESGTKIDGLVIGTSIHLILYIIFYKINTTNTPNK